MDNEFRKNKNEVSNKRSGYSIFDPFFDGFFSFPSFKDEFKEDRRMMRTDIKEKEKEYELQVEMPGLSKKDISLDLNNGYLTIEAKHSNETEEKDDKHGYIRRERYYGSSARSFYVGDVEEKDIDAKLENGILYVTVPKEKKQETKKRIEIK